MVNTMMLINNSFNPKTHCSHLAYQLHHYIPLSIFDRIGNRLFCLLYKL